MYLRALLFFLILFVGCIHREGTSPGDNAPNFSLSTVDGKIISLSDYKGRVVVLNILGSYCEPCKEEMPALERLNLQLKEKDISVVSVGVFDNFEDLKELAKKTGITFPVAIDNDSYVAKKYQSSKVPETFIIDKQGLIVLFPDPLQGPTARITGPRDWDSDMYKNALLKVAER